MSRAGSVVPAEASELTSEYAFLAEIGRGGTAVVYLAEDRELHRRVAIKLIQSPMMADSETLQRFAQEARTASLLRHPNIVGVHAVKRLRSGALALVMQYVPGGTLKEFVQQHAPLPVSIVEGVLRDIVQALAYAHRRGIVHRDVKPENIFLDAATGKALLADFGIARTTEAACGLTLQGIAIGTPAYMAPEQIDGTAIDGRADLYSLALVIWEMLTGEAPWEGDSLYSILYKQKHERLAPVQSYRADVPFHIWRTIEKAAEKDPGNRFPNALAMLESIDRAPRLGFWMRWLAGWRLLHRHFRPDVVPPPPAVAIDPPIPGRNAANDAAATIRFPRAAAASLTALASVAETGAAAAGRWAQRLAPSDEVAGGPTSRSNPDRPDASRLDTLRHAVPRFWYSQSGGRVLTAFAVSLLVALGAAAFHGAASLPGIAGPSTPSSISSAEAPEQRPSSTTRAPEGRVGLDHRPFSSLGVRPPRAIDGEPRPSPTPSGATAWPAPATLGKNACSLAFGAVSCCWGASGRKGIGSRVGAVSPQPQPAPFARDQITEKGAERTRGGSAGEMHCWESGAWGRPAVRSDAGALR